MRYQVFDNNRPADCKHCKVHKSWGSSTFDTFKAANEYAQKWLGEYAGLALHPNQPVYYSGYGDLIEIRTIE